MIQDSWVCEACVERAMSGSATFSEDIAATTAASATQTTAVIAPWRDAGTGAADRILAERALIFMMGPHEVNSVQRAVRLVSLYDETSLTTRRNSRMDETRCPPQRRQKGPGMTPKTAAHGPRDDRGVLAARILREARASFAEHGYAGTSVRAVARAADVDPALVYHYYASKEGLLDAATTPPQSFLDQIVAAWKTPQGELGEQLVRRMLRNWEDPDHGPVLRAILQIAGNEPATAEKLRFIIERSMMGPSAQALDESERLARSSLIASQLMGLAFMRYVWKIEPIATMPEDDLVTAIAPTIQRYLEGDTGRDAAQLQHHRAPHPPGSTPEPGPPALEA